MNLIPTDYVLFGPLVKIERAKKHIRDLDDAIRDFLDGHPYQVVANRDPETGDHVLRVRVARQVPNDWGAIIGDAIHNLRSALDLLICRLVVANNGRVKRSTGFPVGDNLKEFEAALSKKAEGISADAVKLVGSFHPYKGSDNFRGPHNALWQLHKLDVLDKHRLLIPVGAAHRGTIVTATVESQELAEPVILDPFQVSPTGTVFPLQDGAELFRVAPDVDWWEHNFTIDTDYQPTFEIAFGKNQIVDGEPVIPTLQQFLRFVMKVVHTASGLNELQAQQKRP